MSASDQDQPHQPPPQTQQQPSQQEDQDHPQTEEETQTAEAQITTTTTTTTTSSSSSSSSEQQRQLQSEEQPQPPASPPLPQKHTAATPGPRATRFTQLYDLALQRTLQKVSYDNFASCFPTIAAHAPNTLRNVQKQMIDYLEERCNKDFQSILVDRDVVRKLNELESLVSDAERRRLESGGDDAEEPTPPHLLPIEDVMAAQLAPRLASQQSHLNARLQNTQAANESLFASVRSQRAEVDALLAQIEAHVLDIDGANELLVDVASELASEARAAEAQMSGL